MCMIVRGLIAFIAFLLSQDIVDDCLTKLRIMGMFAILPALGWTFLLLMNSRSSFFGGEVWWFWLRIVHILLYLTFSYLAVHGIGLAWVALALDALVGLFGFAVRYGLVRWFKKILDGPIGYIIKLAVLAGIVYGLWKSEIPPKQIFLGLVALVIIYYVMKEILKRVPMKKILQTIARNTRVKISGTKRISVTVTILEQDYSNVLSLPEAIYSYTSANGSGVLEWLRWILLGGGGQIIAGFEFSPLASPFSRTGGGLMVAGNGWRVPPSLSGTATNNILTRSLQNIEQDIKIIVNRELQRIIK